MTLADLAVAETGASFSRLSASRLNACPPTTASRPPVRNCAALDEAHGKALPPRASWHWPEPDRRRGSDGHGSPGPGAVGRPIPEKHLHPGCLEPKITMWRRAPGAGYATFVRHSERRRRAREKSCHRTARWRSSSTKVTEIPARPRVREEEVGTVKARTSACAADAEWIAEHERRKSAVLPGRSRRQCVTEQIRRSPPPVPQQQLNHEP